MRPKPNRLIPRAAAMLSTAARRAAMMLLMMLLTTVTAWAEEVTAVYIVTFNTTTHKTTLTHNGGNYESVTWDYISGTNSTPWNAGATHGVDDEYDITFKPNKYLTLVGYEIRTSAETKFTVTVGAAGYYIKSVGIGGVTANAGQNAKTVDVTVPDGKTILAFSVTLIRYYTVTPASGLQVNSSATVTEGGTKYYKAGTTVTVAPTNLYHIVEGTGGTGSATANVAADKRSFSFTMPDQNVSPSATLTEVYQVTPASGITLSPAAYFTYDGARYYKPNTTITLSSNVPTGQHVTYKASYNNGNKTLTGNTYTVNSSDKDVTLSALLEYNTYTVQFNKNHTDATGSMSNQAFTYGTAQNLRANAFSRTGYTFGGWATSATGSKLYDDQQSVNNLTTTNNGTVTLYALWTANQYTVTLDNQGGNGGSSSTTATYDAAMPAITVPTRTGYTFGGYYTAANGGGIQYYNADGTSAHIWDKTAATTLYAKWTVNQYTVTFDKQGGNGGSSSTTATYDAAMPAITVPTRTGYTFGGYYTAANGGGTKYYNADGTSAHIWDKTAATTTLYAKWTANQYTVMLDGQSATTAGTTEVTATYDAAMPAITVPTRTCYTFGGYYTAANGGGTLYYNADGTSAHIWDITAAATTLYAKWTAITYTITYNLNGGTLETDKNSYTIESPDITLDTPTRTGFIFDGWYDNSGLTGTAVTSIDHGSTGDKQFWAKWLVPYIDADGKTQTCSNFTVLTNSTNIDILSAGWYVVTEDVSYNSRLYCGSGDIHLILCDDAKMTVESKPDIAISMDYGSLTIYAQSTGSSMGQLEATASNKKGIDAYGSVTICGGNITVTGGNNEEGIRAEGSITIHSGQVRASGGSGIYANNNITLGLRNVTDYITASSYNKNVNIADGQTLIDGTAAYTGNNVSIPAGQTLQLPVPVTLADGITATSGIVEIGDDYYAKAGATVTVTVNTSGMTAPMGYTYSGISVTPDADVTDNGNGTYSFTMPAEDATVSAVFAPIDWANEGRSGDDNANAYMIYNKDQLLLLAYRVNGTHGETANSYNGKWFRLGADIKFTYDPNEGEDDYEENYEAIGNGFNSFRGFFDGKGHTISGIRIRKTGTSNADSYQGLFGYISGNVSNIHLTDARIQGHHYVGGIVGYNSGGDVGFTDVTDSYFTANGNYGTICGYNFFGTAGLTRNYYHHCTVNGTAKATNVGCNGANITYNDAAIPLPVLSDTEDNTDAIATLSTRVSQGLPMFHSVMLEGRTLSKNGEWNTLCLPFHVVDGDSGDGLSFTGTPLEGATVKELNVTTSNLTNGTLTLNFSDNLTAIEAGKPYIVKWEGTSGSLTNPIFQGISVTSTEPTAVNFTGGSFVGQYSPFSIVADNIDEIILLSTGNRLGYSQNPRTLRSFRAHFEIPTSGGVREFVLNFDDENTTGIISPAEIKEITDCNATLSKREMAGAWYSIDGRKLDTKPTAKGVYIRGGKKVIIK